MIFPSVCEKADSEEKPGISLVEKLGTKLNMRASGGGQRPKSSKFKQPLMLRAGRIEDVQELGDFFETVVCRDHGNRMRRDDVLDMVYVERELQNDVYQVQSINEE